jgi:uncharacterized cupin superfamily protein
MTNLRRIAMTSNDIQAALASAPEINLDAHPTPDQLRAAFPRLASFDKGEITVGRFSGRSPWERHVDSDEFLHVLDGEVEITLLTGDDSIHVTISAGSIFVIPRGLWHRQVPRPVATVLSLIPTDHGSVSFAEDPRVEV